MQVKQTVSTLVIVAALCLGSFLSASAVAQQKFAQANDLYREHKFQEALEHYKTIAKKSASVHFNMGNCAYKLKKYGEALLHWRRAERDWGFGSRGELLDNIALVKTKLEQTPSKGRLSVLTRFITSYVRSIPLIYFQAAVLLVWVTLFVWIRRLYSQQRRALILTLFCFVAFFGMVLAMKYSLTWRTIGIVVRPAAKRRSGPGTTFATLGALPEGTEVAVIKTTGDYYKIRAAREIGWVDQTSVGLI